MANVTFPDIDLTARSESTIADNLIRRLGGRFQPAALNQGLGDQGENLIPPSLILIPDVPDVPEVPVGPNSLISGTLDTPIPDLDS